MGTTVSTPSSSTAAAAAARPHREVAADGQEGDVGPMQLADELHVAEDVRVAGEVDPPPILQLDDEADWLADVGRAAGRGVAEHVTGGVVRVDHGHADAAGVEGAALVHAGDLIHTSR